MGSLGWGSRGALLEYRPKTAWVRNSIQRFQSQDFRPDIWTPAIARASAGKQRALREQGTGGGSRGGNSSSSWSSWRARAGGSWSCQELHQRNHLYRKTGGGGKRLVLWIIGGVLGSSGLVWTYWGLGAPGALETPSNTPVAT